MRISFADPWEALDRFLSRKITTELTNSTWMPHDLVIELCQVPVHHPAAAFAHKSVRTPSLSPSARHGFVPSGFHTSSSLSNIFSSHSTDHRQGQTLGRFEFVRLRTSRSPTIGQFVAQREPSDSVDRKTTRSELPGSSFFLFERHDDVVPV